MGEPGGLPSMGSHRVRHNCSNLAAAAAAGGGTGPPKRGMMDTQVIKTTPGMTRYLKTFYAIVIVFLWALYYLYTVCVHLQLIKEL